MLSDGEEETEPEAPGSTAEAARNSAQQSTNAPSSGSSAANYSPSELKSEKSLPGFLGRLRPQAPEMGLSWQSVTAPLKIALEAWKRPTGSTPANTEDRGDAASKEDADQPVRSDRTPEASTSDAPPQLSGVSPASSQLACQCSPSDIMSLSESLPVCSKIAS